MIRLNHKVWIAALGAGAITSFAMLPSVHAELVYENSPSAVAAPTAQAVPTAPAAEPTQITSQVNDRAALRQTLESSEKAKATVQATQPQVQVQNIVAAPVAAPVAAAPVAAAPQPVPVVQAAPVYAPAPVQALAAQPAIDAQAGQPAETQNMSHAEMIRRERMREELKNEDVLQTRLEELRMKDEQKRTGQILAPVPDAAPAVAPAAPAPVAAPQALQSQPVAAPVTEHPGQAAAAPVLTQGQQVASIQGAEGASGTSVATTHEAAEPLTPQKSMFSITGGGGISNITTNNAGYSVSPQFSTGVSLGLNASDYVTIQLGYTYSQYNVGLTSENSYYAYTNGQNLQTLTLNQNVFSAGVKIDLLGPDSRIRPYVSGGGAYSKGYVNYNSQILSQINANPYLASLGTDYDVSQYLGYLGAGLDVAITRNISVGVDFKYYDVISSNQNNNLNNYAFSNSYVTPDKAYVGGSLANANFYTMMAGVTFSM